MLNHRRICSGFSSIILNCALLLSAIATQAASLSAEGLKCECRINPLGIDTVQPRLSWILHSPQRGQAQHAYRVLAASTPDHLKKDEGDLWDSGKVLSCESIQIAYAGKALHSGERVHWKVRTWDKNDKPSDYSDPAWFEMALLNPKDWQAKWITDQQPLPAAEAAMFEDNPAPLFRKQFTAEKKITRARAYVSGLGYYELHLNGQRVGDHVLDPGWTTYSKRVLYS